MTEEKQKSEENKEVKAKEHKQEEKKPARAFLVSKEDVGRIIRILQTDVPGNKSVYAGLTRIKGVSWAISNAVCILNKIPKNKKVESLSKEEIQKIEETLREHKFPKFLLNRRNDFSTGKDGHVLTNELDLNEEMDIKRLKKIRSYRGLRHAMGQPTRGQRTKSHFRANRKRGVGLKNKKSSGGQASGELNKKG